MECPVCTANDKEPKRLSCSHTICVECAQKLIDTVRHHPSTTGPRVKCPLCKQYTQVEQGLADSLPTNLLWKRVQNVQEDNVTLTTERSKCCGCDQNINRDDIKWCQDCHKDMCVRCAAKHIEQVIFKDHKINNKITIQCKQHEGICEYYCTKCDKFLCFRCVQNKTGDCRNHPEDRTKLDQIKEEKAKYICDSQVKIKEKVTVLKQDIKAVMEKTKTKRNLAKDTKQEVKAHFSRLMTELQAREKETMAKIDRWEIPFIDLEEKLNSEQADLFLLQELDKSMEEGLKGGVDHVVIAAALLKTSLPAAHTNVPLPKGPNTSIKFVPEDSISAGHLQLITPSTEPWSISRVVKVGLMGALAVLGVGVVIYEFFRRRQVRLARESSRWW